MILVVVHKTEPGHEWKDVVVNESFTISKPDHEWTDVVVNESFKISKFFSVDDFFCKEKALFTIEIYSINKKIHVCEDDIVIVNGKAFCVKGMNLADFVTEVFK